MSGGHQLAVGPCYVCERLFTFDPDNVASIPVDTATSRPFPEGTTVPAYGVHREPICYGCAKHIAEGRVATGKDDLWHGQWGTP